MVTTRDSLVHATTRLRSVRSAMSAIRDVYRLDRDPLYKDVDATLSDLSSDLRKARQASEITYTREVTRSRPKSLCKGDEIIHTPTGFYAIVLRVEDPNLKVAWIDSKNKVHSDVYRMMDCRRV